MDNSGDWGGYLDSQPLRTAFCAACLAFFAARFSFRVRPGFFASADGFDFSAMGTH